MSIKNRVLTIPEAMVLDNGARTCLSRGAPFETKRKRPWKTKSKMNLPSYQHPLVAAHWCGVLRLSGHVQTVRQMEQSSIQLQGQASTRRFQRDSSLSWSTQRGSIRLTSLSFSALREGTYSGGTLYTSMGVSL